LAKLIKKAESDSFDQIKDLIDYLVLYKASAQPELILQKGIALVTRYPSKITLESK
jgi:hypothetical protein